MEQQRAAKKKATLASAGYNFPNQQFGSPFGGQQNDQQQGGTWYFYNDAAVSAGRSQFLSRWGNRPLEDNWRRSRKGAQVTFQENNNENNKVANDSTQLVTEMGEKDEDVKAKLMEHHTIF